MSTSTRLQRAAYGAAVCLPPSLAGVIGGELSMHGSGVNVWDKAQHFTAYFILSLLAVIALKARRVALWAVLGLIALGGLLEIIQGMIGRDADIHDEFANTLGATSGGLLGWAVIALLLSRTLVDRPGPH